MTLVKTCRSCGRLMQTPEDFGGGDVNSPYCSDCTDEFGYLKSFRHVTEGMKNFIMLQMGLDEHEAQKMAAENIARIPHWARKEDIMKMTENLIIADIGSTTTKAVLFRKDGKQYRLAGLQNFPTTVERPTEDVKIGIYQALKKLQQKTDYTLLASDCQPDYLQFSEDTTFLATSSAGGGLQILVLGLTLFDSASSAERAAYGAGGVILDTFAIDDKRSAVEKMHMMQILHPDIILFSGGVDDGAITPIVRLGEILALARPKPKFGEKTKIPLVFAGNQQAQDFVRGLFSKPFDLHLTENLRPTMEEENLEPAREKIHQLFMDNVMEQAPGYSQVKHVVKDPIIPTPLGVIKALEVISRQQDANILAADIGGATTDIFSNILGRYYRTVSANYGMSYSVANVLADAGMENLYKWLPAEMDETYIRNYIGNKMLYPAYLPQDDRQLAIEHAVAREALRMAKEQHMEMNFNTESIGYLDRLKYRDIDKFEEMFWVEKSIDKRTFHDKDITILIGAGGVLSNAPKREQALMMIVDGLQPQGITEVWRDNHFISPHLGKLSELNEDISAYLLNKVCYEKLALTIRPRFDQERKHKSDSLVMALEIDGKKELIGLNELRYFKIEEPTKIKLVLEKGFHLQNNHREVEVETELPLLIDTRLEAVTDFALMNQALQLYRWDESAQLMESAFQTVPGQEERKKIFSGQHHLQRNLPYSGEIYVQEGDTVAADTLVGENRYEPPRIFVLSLFQMRELQLTPDVFKKYVCVEVGDAVQIDQKLVEIGSASFSEEILGKHHVYRSPVRGKIEAINFEAGTIILREIQDYSTKPVRINACNELGVKPKHLRPFLKKQKGDFVYRGENLAVKMKSGEAPVFLVAPTTGTLKEINEKTGELLLQYDVKPYKKYAALPGKISAVEPHFGATVAFTGHRLLGMIGFGAEAAAEYVFIDNDNAFSDSQLSNKIWVYPHKMDAEFLQKAVQQKAKGVVTAAMDDRDLVAFIGKEIGVALTGGEAIPFPLILTEGFGQFEMNDTYAQFFEKHTGKWLYLNGHTQIRAGVTRPEMIVLDES